MGMVKVGKTTFNCLPWMKHITFFKSPALVYWDMAILHMVTIKFLDHHSIYSPEEGWSVRLKCPV